MLLYAAKRIVLGIVILLIVVLVLPGGFGELITNLLARLRREPLVSSSIEPDLEALRVAIRAKP